jgi:hypothetical protein
MSPELHSLDFASILPEKGILVSIIENDIHIVIFLALLHQDNNGTPMVRKPIL